MKQLDNFSLILGRTLTSTNMEPENEALEEEIPFGIHGSMEASHA